MKTHSPGTRLGQFEVVSSPDSSDVTIDYICFDHERACPVLLKTLRPELLASQTARDYFAHSGVTWVGLGSHPHIVRCHNVFKPQNSDEAYLVLQAVVPEKERTTSSLLAWLIPGKPLPVFQALLFALQIARGMRYVVNQLPGFVYGDLKPESVLVGAGRLSQVNVNRLRVTDFGLASVLRADGIDPAKFRQTGAVPLGRTQLINGGVGTPLYMSLEQWYGESAGTATDVYALGCLLYKMLVGRHLVGGETLQALQADHCTGNLRPLPGTLPKVVRDMTMRCLALEPKARYQSWRKSRPPSRRPTKARSSNRFRRPNHWMPQRHLSECGPAGSCTRWGRHPMKPGT